MSLFWTTFQSTLPSVVLLLLAAYGTLLLSWPLFLWLERRSPAGERVPRATYRLNWRITLSNLFLAPLFAAAVVVSTLLLTQWLGLPSLDLPAPEVSLGLPLLDLLASGALIFLAACFLGDFWYYWWHRAQHQLPFLWEMHKLHHSDEHLNSTTIYRSHFLEPAGQSLCRGLSIGLLFDIHAAPPTLLAAIAGGLALGLWDYFIHANVRIDALSRLLPYFSTPQFHWIHHSREPEHQDKNFAIWLPLFDVVFGTYYRPRVDEYPPTGLSSTERFDTVWAAQSAPFKAWARGLRTRLSVA